MDIVPGSFIEGNSKGWFNTSYYIDAKGKFKGKYRKINLWYSERKYLSAGRKVSVFKTKYGRAGFLICWDLIFSEVFREMISKNVKFVYCPRYWCKQDAGIIGPKHDKNVEIKTVNSLCTSRAFENGIILVYANAAGKFEFGKYKSDLINQSQITFLFKGL